MAITKRDLEYNVIGFRNCPRNSRKDMVACALRIVLKREDIEPSSIRLSQKITDADGVVGLKNRKYDIDFMIDGESLLVFGAKIACDSEMAEWFADKVALMKHIHSDKTVNGALISFGTDPKVIGYLKKHDIALVN